MACVQFASDSDQSAFNLKAPTSMEALGLNEVFIASWAEVTATSDGKRMAPKSQPYRTIAVLDPKSPTLISDSEP